MDHSFKQLRALFEQCVDLPEFERLDWIETHVSDPEQRIELQLMLAADGDQQDLLQNNVVSLIQRLDDDAASEFDPAVLVGARFGAFELQKLLGKGGQGAVYLAHRVDQDFQQVVAVKLLRRGIHDGAEHRRFRREREILARFEHPGVARLIDGGVSSEGVPYLAMEYVDGQSIDVWCKTRGLDQNAKIQLFSRLCLVVAAAHRALIVHRDLKPSNVMVAKDGAIKVLDFGIARLLDEDEPKTQSVLGLMTPGYGAPEQATGGAITLATDVYALGMLLRALLTGEAPEAFPGRVPPALPATLPQDLRWIVGKACASEPELRYRDAAELNEDILRFLNSKPVLAHPPSPWYRTRKFMHRHRGSLLITLFVVIGILSSLGLALWQGQLAREQAQRAEAVRDFLLGIFDAAKEDLPRDARPTPENLARAAAKRLDGDHSLSPLMRGDFFGTLASISFSSSDFAQAIDFSERALILFAAGGDLDSRQRLDLEVLHANALRHAGKIAEAAQALGPRMSVMRAELDNTTMLALNSYALIEQDAGHLDAATALAGAAVAAAQKLYGRDSQQALNLATAQATTLLAAGQNQQAADILEQVMRRWRASPLPRDRAYAASLMTAGYLKYQVGQTDAAETLMREALQVRRQVFTPPHELIADALQNLGALLAERGNLDGGEALLRESAAMYEALFGAEHPQTISALNAQAGLETKRGRYAEALPLVQRATAACTNAKLDSHSTCANSWRVLALVLLKLDRLDEAAAASARNLSLQGAIVGAEHPAYAKALTVQADIQIARGEPDKALETAAQAIGILVAKGQQNSFDALAVFNSQARALAALDRGEAALAALQSAETIRAQLAPADPQRRLAALALRAELLSTLGQSDQARLAARAAIALKEKAVRLSEAQWQRLEILAR